MFGDDHRSPARQGTPFSPSFLANVMDDRSYWAVAKRRIRYIGALAARGTHPLQSLGRAAAYDDNVVHHKRELLGPLPRSAYSLTSRNPKDRAPVHIPYTH